MSWSALVGLPYLVRALIVFFISMVPIVELRGAIPIGAALDVGVVASYIISVIGNMLPVPVILLFSKKILLWCCTWKHGGKLFQKIHEKGTKAGHKLMEKAGRSQYLALYLFVAIPLPGTGAWTGCLAATLLDMKFWPSTAACAAGVATAGVIMGVLSAFGLMIF